MIPKSIDISGFRSFPAPVTFLFPKDPGLFFISGENRDEPQLDGNGSGKTTLFETIPYALYGKTSIGHKGPKVASWIQDTAPTRVGFTWETNGTPTTVTRGYKPTVQLLQTGDRPTQTFDQATIDDHVGLTYDQFLATVLFAQFGTGFMDLKPSGQLAAFSAALNLGQWSAFAKRAVDKVAGYKDQSEAVTAKRARARGAYETARQAYNSRADEADAWDLAEKRRLAEVGTRRETVIARIDKLQGEARAQLDAIRDAEQAQADERKALTKKEAKLDTFDSKREAKLAAIEKEIDAELLADGKRLEALRSKAANHRDTTNSTLAALQTKQASALDKTLKAQSVARNKRNTIADKRAEAHRDHDLHHKSWDDARKALEPAENMLHKATAEDPVCGTCYSPLIDAIAEELADRLATDVARLRKAEALHDDRRTRAKARADKACEVLIAHDKIVAAADAEVISAKSKSRDTYQARASELQAQQDQLDSEADTLATQLASGRRALEARRLTATAQAMDAKRLAMTRALRQARHDLTDAGDRVTKLRSRSDTATRDLEAAERELTTLDPEPRTNPHDKPLASQGAGVDMAESEVSKLQREFDALETRIDRYGYWRGSFPRLRLWLLQGAAMEFEVMFNNNLGPLGLDGWEVECRTTRELKTGEERPELTTLVTKPGCISPAPFDGFSGGEQQRLRNAGKAAFADVVRSRMALPPMFELWDEPTAHLSLQGCEDLISWLRERSRVQGRQVWTIDHRTRFAGDVDAHMRFILERGQTTIETDL